MAFEEFSVIDDGGWYDMPLVVQPTYLWNDGGLLADAPVDFAKTFGTNMQVAKKVDQSFKLNGLRCTPNFAVPKHHHNMDELIICLGGSYTVRWEDEDGVEVTRTIEPGGFWVSRAGTAYQMSAGPEGVVYTECWAGEPGDLLTWWHDECWVRT